MLSALGEEMMQEGKFRRALCSFIYYTPRLFGVLHGKQVFLKGKVCLKKKDSKNVLARKKTDHMVARNGTTDPRLALLPACSLVALVTG